MGIYLGIDVGTSGAKALAINDRGTVMAVAVSEYPAYHPRPLWSEQEPDDWWRAVVKSVRNVVRQPKVRAAEVRAIGLTGQMHGSVFLDKSNRVLRRAILWNDQRTAAECDQIEKLAGGRRRLIRLVANPALAGFTAPKILWLRNHEPRCFDKTAKVLLPKDEIRRRLTGEFATDVSDASGTLLLDVARRRWSHTLLSKLDLDEQLLPDVYESHELTGSLTTEAARTLGLSTKCVVVAGAGDCAAGAVGNGIVSTGTMSTSIGTSGVVFVHCDEMKVDPAGRLHTFCHAVDGRWHMMGVNLSAGGALQWFRNALCGREADAAKRAGKDVYDVLAAEAAKIDPGSEGLFFLPYLAGERTPHADPTARGCFIGLTLKHTRGYLVRAVMEGVTYALRDSLEIIRQMRVPVRQIRASGGGAKSPLWRQIQADVFGQKVVRTVAEEGPAYGAALLAAVGVGTFKDVPEACRATVRVRGETPTNARAKRLYDRTFPIYQRLYQSLREDFQQIATLG